jgi:hypothetical protein
MHICCPAPVVKLCMAFICENGKIDRQYDQGYVYVFLAGLGTGLHNPSCTYKGELKLNVVKIM